MATAPPKNVLRSLPTLTEVVALPSEPASAPGVDTEAIFKRVMQRLELTLEDVVRSALRNAVQEAAETQLPALGAQVRLQVEREVRQMIVEAVASERQQTSRKA